MAVRLCMCCTLCVSCVQRQRFVDARRVSANGSRFVWLVLPALHPGVSLINWIIFRTHAGVSEHLLCWCVHFSHAVTSATHNGRVKMCVRYGALWILVGSHQAAAVRVYGNVSITNEAGAGAALQQNECGRDLRAEILWTLHIFLFEGVILQIACDEVISVWQALFCKLTV